MLKPDEKTVVVVLPRRLLKEFKSACVQRDRSMKSVLERAIVNFTGEGADPQREPKRQQPEA